MVRQWIAARRSLVATLISAVVVAALVATIAVVSTGYTAQRLDLGDGSVWVPNGTDQVIGRANTQVLELNTVVASAGTDLDVVQRGSTVLLFDHANGKIDIVDPATSKVLDSVPLPPQSPEVFLAGDNAVIHSQATGQVWIVPVADLAKFDAESQATLSLGADSVASVTPDGILWAYSQSARQLYRVDAAHSDSADQTNDLTFGAARDPMSITSVGDHWALLDAQTRVLRTDSGTVDLSKLIPGGATPTLQRATSAGDSVLVSFTGGLVSVPLGGGDPRVLVSGRSGFPAAPVTVNGCTFAAWSDGTGWRRCGQGEAATMTLASMPPTASRLALQINGGDVVLNDPQGGATWAVQQGGQLIDNWSDLIVVKKDQQQVEQNDEDTPPDFDKTQQPPVAVHDDFGARPGRTSVLPVLLNDYDPNGDVLIVTDVGAIDESVGHLDIINDSQQLQITLAPAASGSVTFDYSISDGRGGTASATVTVTVRQPSENSPPVQVRQTKALVAQGGRVTTSVLGDWVDPDGDPFYLQAASTVSPDAVTYKPEGSVVFSEGGSASALRAVALTVSDGRAAGSGSLAVTVKAPGQVPIIVDPFAQPAYAGQEITVSPLDHVRGGTGTIRLSGVPAKPGATITASLEAGTFQFSSDQVGTHYLDFVVTDGSQTATGTVRVEVQAPPDPNTKPVTIPKTVFVHTLSSQTVDIASTDYDPAGGVLMVTGIENLPTGSGVRAEVLEQSSVRVTLTAPLASGTVAFNYRVSNGLADAQGVITVIEIPAPSRLQPPIAEDDSVTVRVGDAIDIPVLDNDTQPDGEDLTLDPRLSSTLAPGSGLLFVSGSVLRYLAPQKPGNFTAVYQVSGPDGQVAQARVSIAVREADADTNNPPVPQTVTGRVLAGETVRIPIPLTGIDPDGDSVQLLGQETNPQKGSVTTVGPDYFDYQAGDYSTGTDSFTYTVIDGLGARATGLVRVGISQRLAGASNPVAVEDEVRTRPGTTVSVQVLANDSNPDGGALTITSVVPNTPDVKAKIVGDLVKVTPPRTPGRYGLVYTIENAHGGTSSNFVTVDVDPNAPRAYPVVSDTVLNLTDILGRTSIDVNVLRNVFFADGDVGALTVSLLPGYSSGVSVTTGKRLHVTIGNKSQIIPFAVARPDEASVVSYGFVWVPGFDDALPQVNRKAPPLTVASESTLTIDLADYVLAIGGKQVRLADTTTVQATHSNGADLVVNDHTLRFTSANQYFGPASISFEVTDGTSADDPHGRKATLVLPIKVTPRENQPPVFIGGVIDFEPGQSKEIDLQKLTNYPYPRDVDELTYAVQGAVPSGFSYTLSGQRLVLRADESAVKGTSTGIQLGVKDALSTGRSGRITLNVVASSRPLASPAADSVRVPRGQTTSVDVLANDQATNPFPGRPLKVIAIRGLDGGGVPAGVTITPSADNSRLSVQVSSTAEPADTNLQYEVADATNDPDRYVWGNVRISVQDRPDPVTGVRPIGFSDRTVTLRWTPGADNNSPITGYDVLEYTPSLQLISTTTCTIAVCDIPTPGNGQGNAVRMRVVAKNALGASTPAGIGGTVWSDILPAAPDRVSADPEDGGLAISWTPVPDPAGGSPVQTYVVTAGGSTVDVDPSSCRSTCSTEIDGLTNGQAVSVTVSAHNSAYPALTTWNSKGTTQTPAGKPLVVAAVSASASDDTISASWNGAFSANGTPIRGYAAFAYTGAPPGCPAAGDSSFSGATSTTFSGLSSEQGYSVIVFARNDQGCTNSAPVAAHTTPGRIVAATGGGPSPNGGAYDFTLASAQIVAGTNLTGDYTFYYRLSGGAAQSTEYGPIPLGGLLTAAGSQYGSDISVQLRACRSYDGAAPICQSQYSDPFPLGVAVNPQVGPVTFTPDPDGGVLNADGTFTWSAWPTGAYQSVAYWCGSGTAGTFTAADTSVAGGTCHADVPLLGSPKLTIRVTANGGATYDVSYDSNGTITN